MMNHLNARFFGPLAIVDPCCGAGYGPDALVSGGLGGTEATILRVCMALAERADIVHYQKGRTTPDRTAAGRLLPLDAAFTPAAAPPTYVVINAWKVACKLRKVHPDARILLWLHIFPGRHNRAMGKALVQAGVDVVCVSASHAKVFRAFVPDAPTLTVRHIHNPIADDLTPDATSVDPDRLLFASSPHKGLAQVFRQFTALRDAFPDLHLAVADPGYLVWDTGPVPEGVTFLGALPHAALIAQMRRALCLFYPQTTFAETFGLVMAEANAVGLPVLAHHDIGANAEVLDDPRQLIDGTDTDQIIARIGTWRAARPAVTVNPDFRLRAVVRQWDDLLSDAQASDAAIERVA